LVDAVGASTALKEAELTPMDKNSQNVAREGSLREAAVPKLLPPHPHVLDVSIPTFSEVPITTAFNEANASPCQQTGAPVVYMRTTMPRAVDGTLADYILTHPKLTLSEVRFWIIINSQ
jgi:hypothetical protein